MKEIELKSVQNEVVETKVITDDLEERNDNLEEELEESKKENMTLLDKVEVIMRLNKIMKEEQVIVKNKLN